MDVRRLQFGACVLEGRRCKEHCNFTVIDTSANMLGKRRSMSVSQYDTVEILLLLGASMLRAGSTAARSREWIDAVARKLGAKSVSANLAHDSITISVDGPDGKITALHEIGSSGINIRRLEELEWLAKNVAPEDTLDDIAAKLAHINAAPPLYSRGRIVVAVGAASAAFAFLNGADIPEMLAAATGGGFGQGLRSWLSRRSFNQYGVAALSAFAASGVYVLAAAMAGAAGLAQPRYPAGFIASVLFLVPGFPVIGGLFDLLQNQTTAAVSRLAHGVMLLLAVALGLSIVTALAGVDLVRQPPFQLIYTLQLALRAIASVIASCAFAMLFNCPVRSVVAAGLVAFAANDLRLALIDMGMMLAPAAFLAALCIGLATLLLSRRLGVIRMAMVVPATVIMVPGLYAFETVVFFNRGDVLQALQAFASCGFVIGGLAMGLAAARFFETGGALQRERA